MMTKKERQQYNQEYRAKNRDKIFKQKKEYREKSQDKIKVYNKTYNKSKYKKENDKKYREKNRDELAIRHKEYYREKREEILAYHKTPKVKFGLYRRSAKCRDLEFNLTFEEFMTFWQKPCSYCGDPIETIGIDRVDNQEGYIMYNLAPCCARCNKTKIHYSAQEFISHCCKIANHSQKTMRRPYSAPCLTEITKTDYSRWGK